MSSILNRANLRINNNEKVVIITPTVGTAYLKTAIESVERQTFPNVIHLIVIDGEEHLEKVNNILKRCAANKNRKILALPFNTGKNDFYGHRIYAACSYIVDADVVFFLDEDNWYDDNHIESLVDTMRTDNLDWAYSLRKIYSHDGKFIDYDNCESLGKWPAFSRMSNLVDTSCYAIRGSVLSKVGHIWFNKFAADRTFFKFLSGAFPNFNMTSLYTLNYRLHENRHPTKEFFYRGNSYMLQRYNDQLPWKT